MHIAYTISSAISTHIRLLWSEKRMTGASANTEPLMITYQFDETLLVVFPVSHYANLALTYLKKHSITH
jgi:hypothetical protein